MKSESSAPIFLPQRSESDHKGTFGRVLFVGGSRGMAGSISLSSIAAMHTGSGLVSAAVPDRILETVASFHPALMTIPLVDDQLGRFAVAAWAKLADSINAQDAIGIGPGMTTGEGSEAIIRGLLDERATPMVLDADALNVIANQNWIDVGYLTRRAGNAAIVLTPHPGELSRLTGVSPKDTQGQLDAARKLVRDHHVTIVVKGGPSHVIGRADATSPVQTYVNTTGNPGMATGGSGDVLTGIITSLLGQGLTGWDAARLGTWVHGRAGDEAAKRTSAAGMTAQTLVECLAIVNGEMER